MAEAEVAKKAAEIATQKAEAAKKLEKAQRDLKTKVENLDRSIRNGQETGRHRIDVKYAANEVARRQKEIDRLK